MSCEAFDKADEIGCFEFLLVFAEVFISHDTLGASISENKRPTWIVHKSVGYLESIEAHTSSPVLRVSYQASAQMAMQNAKWTQVKHPEPRSTF